LLCILSEFWNSSTVCSEAVDTKRKPRLAQIKPREERGISGFFNDHSPQSYVANFKAYIETNSRVRAIPEIFRNLSRRVRIDINCHSLCSFKTQMTAKTVLITGANRGIGLQFAKAYAAMGWSVIATARDVTNATQVNSLPHFVFDAVNLACFS
jgi:hypothetical protein